MIKTNIGDVPINDYLEIRAISCGYDSYQEMLKDGLDVFLCDLDLKEALEILEMEKLCARGEILSGSGTVRHKEFIEAVDIVKQHIIAKEDD